jgi:radical SAM protein with 4Fe4S-binding SPASM domain
MNNKQMYTPRQVVWELTLKCNLKCIHCGSTAGKPRKNEITTKEALKLCRDLKKINTEEVCLMGGEPFLRNDWFKIASKIKNLNMKLLFISNGFKINDEIISKLIKIDPYAVSFSLDGGTPKTHDYIRGVKGSFNKVMESITLCREKNLPLTIITTVNKLNFTELPQIKDFLVNTNIAWQLQIAAPEGRFPRRLALSKEEFYATGMFIASIQKKYTKNELPVIGAHCFGYHSNTLPCLGLYPEWIGCQAGISILSIRSNGDITGCLSISDKYIEGNIRNRSIIDIWNDPDSFSYNRKFDVKDLGENCKGCKFGVSCKGGCMGLSRSFTDNPHNDPYCFYKIEKEGNF